MTAPRLIVILANQQISGAVSGLETASGWPAAVCMALLYLSAMITQA